jgi:hypothetical protein
MNQDQNGSWKMGGPDAILVTKSSATHCRHWEGGAEHICAINRTHSEMVKFEREDDEYEKVSQILKRLAQRALQARGRGGTIPRVLPSRATGTETQAELMKVAGEVGRLPTS